MCGIAGWSTRADAPLSPEALGAMMRALAHRGPDGAGAWHDDARGVALGHRRLSIIDLSDAAAQPMHDDRGGTLVFNGELYNFRALRAELEALGHAFVSSGDAEVALRALSEWGPRALERFCGMFALAYVARGSDRVLLARDPLGIKPLLVAPIDGGCAVLFASELRSLLASGLVSRRIDRDALRQYLEFGYVLDGRRAMLRGVEKVGPGEWVALEAGRIVERGRYYRVPEAPASAPPDADDALLETLQRVLAEHLVADVPVGVLLSGGLDSSVIAALAARQTRVRTLSFGFGGSQTDERGFAREVAQAIGSDHTELLIDASAAIAQLEQNADVFDDLIADGAILSTRLAYREARKLGLKVVLVGEGADELFGGYPVFGAAAALRGPSMWRRFQLYRRYASRRFGRSYPLFARRFGAPGAAPSAWIEAVRRFEIEAQLPNQYVVKVDRASMAESIEARTPYLDRRVAEAAMRFPAAALGVDAEGKWPLRRLAARLGVLPTRIVERRKFGIALAPEWLESDVELRALAAARLLRAGSVADALGFRHEVRAFLEAGRKSLPLPSPFGVVRHLVWRLFLLASWSERLGVAP